MSDQKTGWFHPGQRELPYADTLIESGTNPWEWLRNASGNTASESKLLQLVRSSMLSLWSIPNPYTDEGLASSGSGKELCDLMVIFGDDVLLFSDKDCAFPKHSDIKVAWTRWYRRAIVKSAKQLVGAEGSLRRPTIQLFTDARCTKKLPLDLPNPTRMRVHLIAVAHGSTAAAERYWCAYGGERGSSGSLMLNTRLVGGVHEQEPFQIGWPLGPHKFVHVLDDLTLSLLMNELDTVADFTGYLTKKEKLFRKSGCEFIIPGEEDLLTAYISNVARDGAHNFPDFEEDSTVVMREGSWKTFRKSRTYKARATTAYLSHLWDDLIEYQASHVIYGSSQEFFVGREKERTDSNERILRVMASENRRTRRMLGETLRDGRLISSRRKRFVRTVLHPNRERLYCFVFLPFIPDQQSHSDYRQYRQYLLHLYCEGALLHLPHVKEIIGIAIAPYDSEIVSVDFMYFDVYDSRISPQDRLQLEEQLSAEDIWNKNARFRAVSLVTPPRAPSLLERLRNLRK
ncbi:MAG: hypothetical protein Q7K57_19640 [Burkholderiaceae bacterium]|nr:hypothetical protein [Burkholderiaceae bacterium]